MNAHASIASETKRNSNRGLDYAHPMARRKRGFTIVELLTVVGVIALLMAIAVPALRGVQTRTQKTVESNNIRQVYVAWTVYGNFNRDAAAPGYLDPEVQDSWRVTYEYPLPPDASKPSDRKIPGEIAAPWTWRLFPYLDHNIETTWRYRNTPATNWPALVALARDGALADDGIANVDELMAAVAEEPAFGYNAYHVGGWWEMQDISGSGGGEIPMPLFFGAKSLNGGGSVEVVSRSIPSIRRPADLIVFCTSTMYANAGTHRIRDNSFPGSHVVMPPFLADEARWESPPPANSAHTDRIHTFVAETHAPFGRYNGFPTLINADGSIEPALPVTLFDMRRWIDNPIRTDEPYQPWFTE